jgi:predicted dehydrogenase
LIDLGVHVLDIAMHLLGQPEVLFASAATFNELGRRGVGFSPSSDKTGLGNRLDVEDMATALLRLTGGTALALEVSWASHSAAQDDYGVALLGTEGGAEIRVENYATDNTLTIYTNVAGQPAEIRPKLPPSGFHRAVVREFVDNIRLGQWTQHHGVEALRYSRVIDACYASARMGREVDLAESAAAARDVAST